MNRRDFVTSMASLASMAALSGVKLFGQEKSALLPKDFIWGFMPQFGMNMWGDLPEPLKRKGSITKQLTDEEFAMISQPNWQSRESIRFDEDLWKGLSSKLKVDGCNLILIDVGEFVVYPSHPELAVIGSWSAERMRAEVLRLKSMGFKVIPKLNFSCCHDVWLKDYARMVSTSKYYQVVADLIGDVYAIFDHPEYIHLGLDEEDIVEYQSRNTSLVRFRQGDLWWNDVLFMIKEVERHGARAWMWSDYTRRHSIEEFKSKMPKSVIQSPWSYSIDKPTKENKRIQEFLELAENGYDVIVCGSNCYGYKENLPALATFCKENMNRDHFKGMLLAPWMETRKPYERLLKEGSGIIAETIRRCK